jgi:tetratricopeptide (TPR) repeat protein
VLLRWSIHTIAGERSRRLRTTRACRMLAPGSGGRLMAKTKWAAFAHAGKNFDYAGDKLAKHWDKLHAGDQEPFPDSERIGKLIKANAKLGKAADAAKIADGLQDAWRAYHRGDFQQAYEAGSAFGPLGAVVACKSMGIHAAYLIDDAAAKLERFSTVTELAAAAISALPKEANSHYFHAFALGRYSQGISITKALAQGLAGKVKVSLDATLKLAPKHAEAHVALAIYHAEIVAKVGGMLAGLTYGAKPSIAEEHLKTAQKLAPDAPVVWLELGNALLLLYGDKREDDAAAAFEKAAKLKPIDAMQALDVAAAKDQLA